MKKRIFKNIEWGILFCAIILIAIGIIALYSATAETSKDELNKQIIWLFISIPIVIIVICIDYETITKISPILYGIFLVLLAIVLFTEPINGAKSWFEFGALSFQPSEFAKVFTILTIMILHMVADMFILCSIISFGAPSTESRFFRTASMRKSN